MDDVKNISIRAVVQNDMDAVIDLLQSMSEFKPSKSDFCLYGIVFASKVMFIL